MDISKMTKTEMQDFLRSAAFTIVPQTERNMRVNILNNFFNVANKYGEFNKKIRKINTFDERAIFFKKINENFAALLAGLTKLDAQMERNQSHDLLRKNMLKMLDELSIEYEK
jgi:hypothetical protein